MKKIFLYIIGLAGLSIAFSGCSKGFLETEPTEFTSGDQLAELAKIDPSVGQSKLDGIYALMVQQEAGGFNGVHVDFGQKGNDIISDILSSDMAKPLPGYGWYNGIQQYLPTRNDRDLHNYMFWRFYYKVVLAANQLVESFGENPTFDKTKPVDAANSAQLGQAYALRAYAYFYLTQYFGIKYDPTSKILPLYVKSSDINLPLATQEEVYTQIVADLDKAIELLDGFSRSQKSSIDQSVAKGLLAYTYAAMGKYDKVKELTSDVINSNKFVMMSPVEIVFNPNTKTGSGFNSVDIPGWMWGMDITTSMNLDLISFWGQMDIFTYSYPSVGVVKSMSSQLFSLMRPDDIRRNQFGDYEGQRYVPYNKFFTPEREIQGQRKITTDYVYMRVAEMYMLKIEAEFFLGDEAAAKADLKAFLEGRIADLSYIDGLSGDDLKKEIHTQWRIEFWGEGKSYLAIKRFKEPIITGTNRFDAQNAGQTIQWDDPKLTFVIPNNEKVNNPNIN